MGVPKFYRWLSERYPCLSEVVKEHQIPEFDNLYLDMNGVVHICSHPNDDDVHFRISEEKIIKDIFHYLEVLFRMIQPRKVFFMAIDGVAPRAKMNQQRGRRFRSAKEAELNEKRAKDRGEELPKEARFDSNCITPGTSFMDRLHEQLNYFVVSKITNDSLWQGVKVILSGHETPGEGEHKIMDFIRYERSKPDYDPDTRHCLYGLDADLVMLGMCTHDPHFSLLREEVRFGGKKSAQKRTTAPEETTFHLLHLSLLREYLDHEFSSIKNQLPFPYDLEGIIDDWILLGFLVGNDFLPNLPHLHINKGALTELYGIYKQELPKLGGYINCNGLLNLERFEQFLTALSLKEMDRFDDIYSDNKWLEGKTAKKKFADEDEYKPPNNRKRKNLVPFETVITDTPGPASVEELLLNTSPQAQPEFDIGGWEAVKPKAKKHEQQDLLRLIHSADDFLTDDMDQQMEDDPFDDESDHSGGRDNQYHMEFRQHKREYYIQKLGYSQVTPAVLKEQAECYVRAIQWNLHYYYNGCKSWSWYYPHHFAPWITDIKGFSNMKISFDLSTPFLPFEQLLSVLPAASKELMPKALQVLMTSSMSPIINFYPPEFDTDLNGKQQEWEAIVLIPFIDEKKLLAAMEPYMHLMTPDEKRRNTHGPMQVYTFSQDPLGPYPSPQYFPAIEMSHAKRVDVWRKDWEVPIEKLRKGLLPETRLDVFYPGFPTLKHIPHTAALAMDGVRVFEQPSRGLSMILTLTKEDTIPSLEDVSSDILGKEIWINWPHMVEAKVVGVKDSKRTVYINTNNGSEKVVKESEGGKEDFFVTAKTLAERYKTRWGVKIGKTDIILQACVMTGRKYICSPQGKITLEKQWSKIPQPFALQTTRKDILVHDPSFTQYRTLPELFPIGSTCFMLGSPHYGAQGVVTEIAPQQKGRISMLFNLIKDVDLSDLAKDRRNDQTLQYFPGYRLAQQLGISSHLLSRITGCVFILRGPREAEFEHASKINVGLNLKNNKKNEEVCGYTKRDVDKNNWIYSTRTVQAINDYWNNFPEVFEYMNRSGNLSNDIFHHSDVFPKGDGEARLRELSEWLSVQPFSTASRQTCGTLTLDEGVVKSIQSRVEAHKNESRQTIVKMHVKPHLLFRPNITRGASMPDPDANFHLFDRVVNIRQGFSVPLGLKGTITGLLKGIKPEDTIVEVFFDSEFSGGLQIRSTSCCSYRLPGSALINLSFGNRALEKDARKDTKMSEQKPFKNNHHNKATDYHKEASYSTQQPQSTMSAPNSAPNSGPNSAPNSGPNSAPIIAPDPKSLPNPFGIFKMEPKNNKKNPPRNGQNSNMQQLWETLQGPSNGEAAALPPQQSHAPLGNETDLTEQLKSMLKINQQQDSMTFQHRPRAQHNRAQGSFPHQSPGFQILPRQRQPGSYPGPGAYPDAPGSYPSNSGAYHNIPPPFREQTGYQEGPKFYGTTAFVPLQVHKKQTGLGKPKPAAPKSELPKVQNSSPKMVKKNIVAPESGEQVLKWDAQKTGAQNEMNPTKEVEKKKKRMAANFGALQQQ